MFDLQDVSSSVQERLVSKLSEALQQKLLLRPVSHSLCQQILQMRHAILQDHTTECNNTGIRILLSKISEHKRRYLKNVGLQTVSTDFQSILIVIFITKNAI